MKRLIDKLFTLVRDPRHNPSLDEITLALEILRNAKRANPALYKRLMSDELHTL